MTLSEAYTILLAAWPTASWSIDVHVWHYEHRLHDPPAVEYCVWDGDLHESYGGPTLETAIALALGHAGGGADGALAEAERVLAVLPGAE